VGELQYVKAENKELKAKIREVKNQRAEELKQVYKQLTIMIGS
jgi:hypothetical protein